MQALGDQLAARAEQRVQPDRPARQLPRRHAEQRPRGERLEVDLHAGGAALVADRHRPRVDAAGERAEALALDRPALVEVDDHDDLRVGDLARHDRAVRARREVRVACDQAGELRMRSAAYQVHMRSIPLPSLLDTALDRTLIGYGNLGYLARRRGWPGRRAARRARGQGRARHRRQGRPRPRRRRGPGAARRHRADGRPRPRGRRAGRRRARGRGARRAARRRRARRQLARRRARLRRPPSRGRCTRSSTTPA